MNKIHVPLLALMLCLIFASVSAAVSMPPTPRPEQGENPEVSPTPVSPAPFSEDEKVEAKKTIENLGQIFGVVPATPTPNPNGAPAVTSENKTMADVADKALNMASDFVATIAKMLEGVAPEIWEVFVRQQYAKAIGNLIVPWGVVILSIISGYFVRRNWNYDPEKEGGDDIFKDSGEPSNRGWRGFFGTFIPFVMIICFGLWGLSRLSDAVLLLINPKYYAVQDLLRMLLTPGQTPGM